MPIVLVILLVIIFGYSLMLVIANNNVVALNFLFAEVPSMNLGLVLILSMVLGVLIGLLMALMLFRVFQMKFEISRLKKDNLALQKKLEEADIVIKQNREPHVVTETSAHALTEQAQNQKTFL